MILPLLLLGRLAAIGPALEFDPVSDPARPVTGAGSASAWSLFGDARLEPAALENRTGGLRIPGYVAPKGAFSVEAIFRADEYGAPEWNWLSDLVNTATWTIRDTVRPEQGFTLRLGGGYWYPELGAGAAVSEWSRRLSLDYADVHTSAKLSRCLLDFNMAPTGQKVWFEIFSDRCVEPGTWHHAIATWDGDRQRLYLDGEDVTDPWRIHRPDDTPRLDSGVTLTLAARALASLDFRTLRGGIRQAAVLPGSLTQEEVAARFLHSDLRPAPTACTPSYRILSPLSLQAVRLQDTLQLGKRPGSLCGTGFDTAWGTADSVDVEALDSSFRSLGRLRTRGSRVTLATIPGVAGYRGALQLRLRTAWTNAVAARAAAAQPWGNSLPVLLLSASEGIGPRPAALPTRRLGPGRYLVGTRSPLSLRRPDGQRIVATILPSGAGQLVDLGHQPRGLYLLTSERGGQALLLP